MRSNKLNDYQSLSEHYNEICQQKTIEEVINCLEQHLNFCVEQAKLDEGLAGLATRTKDRISSGLAGAGAAMKNLSQVARGTTPEQMNLQNPTAVANQKKIQNALNRFNRDITALVPNLKQQQPELSTAIDQLNQAAQQPATTETTPSQTTATNVPQTTQQSQQSNPPVETIPANTGSETTTTTKTTNPQTDKKEGSFMRAIKAPGRALGTISSKAKDMETKTRGGGAEALLPGFSDTNKNKSKNTDKTTTTTKTFNPVSSVEQPEQPQTPVSSVEQPEQPEQPQTFEPGEEVLVRTKNNPQGATGVVKQINPNGTINVTTQNNPNGYAFDPANVIKSPRTPNKPINENILGGNGFMSNRWGNFS